MKEEESQEETEGCSGPTPVPMWQNVDNLVSLMETVVCVAKPIVEVVPPYSINFTKVNKHFLSNLPEPELSPVLGCSPDPDPNF